LDGEIASTGFAVLRANPELLNSKFLFYWVQHREFVEFLVANATGASYPAVTDGVVKRARLPLATPKEQSRIVELLDEANLLRRLRREADAKAARILPTLFLKMFGDPATNPKGLRKVPLGKIIKVKSGDFLPAKDMAKKGTYPVYGGNGINGLHDAFMFEEPKIVLGRVGAYCGVVHYSRRNAWITDNALYVSEKLEPIEDQYLVAALEHANLNQYAGRAGQPLISGSRIYPVEILVPAEVEQLAFARSVSDLRKVNDLLDVASQKLDFLWDTMMTRAFSGQLTAKWREGHMKELLAEMEQQARTLNLPVQLETTP
jgi:type I restriction enzyme S subunit